MHRIADMDKRVEQLGHYLPWYKSWIRSKQKNIETLTTLADFPLVTASVLEAHYYTKNNPLAERDDITCYRTSGTSSGLRKSIFYSPSDEKEYLRIKMNVFRSILGTHGYRTAMVDVGTGHAEATAIEVFNGLEMETESLSFQLPIQHHLERLASYRPDVLYTMPSILNRILLAADNPAAYGIRHVILVGEIASPAWIRQASERLGISIQNITDTYGSIEIGTIAYYSHEHGRYLLAEGLIAEGIDAQEISDTLAPLENEEEQILILTSMVREAFPAIRYVTYDVVRDLRPVLVEGVMRQSFQSIVKRIGPDLKHGEKISIYDIENVVYRYLSEASVHVKVASNALVIYIDSPHSSDAILRQIQHDLENRIPEIGMMIQAGIIDHILVTPGLHETFLQLTSIKGKKIVYE